MVFIRGGPSYLVNPNPDKIFWISSFTTFIQILSKNYPLLFVFGLIGMIFPRNIRSFALLSIGTLMFLRCFSKWADDDYSMIFIPGFSFFSLYGIGYLWNWFKQKWKQALLSISIIVFSIFTLGRLLTNFPGGMNRLNSNFDDFILYTAKNFPAGGKIFQRDISLIPYLRKQGRSSFNDIDFWYYPEDKNAAMGELIKPGCKLIFMVRNDQEITEDELLKIGFLDQPYHLQDGSGIWAVYSRDCE